MKTGLDFLLDFYISPTWVVETHPIVVRLPGVNDKEFERDRERFAYGVLVQDVGDVVMRWRPDREEMARWEKKLGASCVVIDWDGRQHYESSRGAGRWITLSEYVLEQCELRLGRTLTKTERRALLRQIDPQVAEGRSNFLDSGYVVAPTADLKRHATWVAHKLLDPSQSWEAISGAQADQVPAVIRACHDFADRAKIRLPQRRGKHPLYTLAG